MQSQSRVASIYYPSFFIVRFALYVRPRARLVALPSGLLQPEVYETTLSLYVPLGVALVIDLEVANISF